MKVTATTLPRNAPSVTSAPSWEVRAKSGAAPIVGSRCSSAASCACASGGHASSPSAMTSAASMAYAFSSRLSSFKKRQSVPSARSAFGLELIMPASCSRSA